MDNLEVINDEKVNNEGEPQQETESKNKISLEQVKQAIETDLDIKGYIDSLIDKNTAKRLEKRLQKELEKHQQLQEQQERERQEKEIIKAYQDKITLLENQVKFNKILQDNDINIELLPFLSREGTTLEELQENINKFKEQLQIEVKKELSKKWIDNPVPRTSEGQTMENKLWSK